MEALILVILALFAIIVVDALYGITITIVNRAPVMAVAALAGWLAHRNGAGACEVLGIALVTAMLMRHLIRLATSTGGPAWTRTRNQTVMSGRL
jgi:carbon starvation protein CstA